MRRRPWRRRSKKLPQHTAMSLSLASDNMTVSDTPTTPPKGGTRREPCENRAVNLLALTLAGTRRGPRGDSGDYVGTMWGPIGDHVGPMWGPRVNHVGT